jgi:hypothetical protein
MARLRPAKIANDSDSFARTNENVIKFRGIIKKPGQLWTGFFIIKVLVAVQLFATQSFPAVQHEN